MTHKLKKGMKTTSIIGWIIFIAVFFGLSLLVVLLRKYVYKDDFSSSFQFLINQVYLDNFLKRGALVLGTLTFVGYLFMKRGFRDSLIGGIKTTIGMLLLSIGSGVIIQMSRPVFSSFQILGGTSSASIVPLDPYFGLASAEGFLNNSISGSVLNTLGAVITEGAKYATWVSYAFMLGLFVNIILILFKKWTNVRSLMITGHIMIQQSAIIVAFLYLLLFRDVALTKTESGTFEVSGSAQFGIIIISGLVLGTYWGVGSTATIKPTNAVTQNAGFAIGHQQMLAIAISYKVGKYFGKKEDSAENKKLPKYLKIFEDNIFTQTFILLILFSILFLILMVWSSSPTKNFPILNEKGEFNNLTVKPWGYKFVDFNQWNVFKGAHFSLNIFAGTLKIVAGLLALITGVRMFITELQQSFQGISEKIIPDSVVAVDVAAAYGFSPNSVTYGFIAGTIAQYAAVGVIITLSLILTATGSSWNIAIPIPLFITLFFNSGSLGVFANATGGYKAAIFVPAIIGFIEVILIAFALGVLKSAASFEAVGVASQAATPASQGYNGMADWNLIFAPLILFSVWNTVLAWIIIVIAILALLVYAQIMDSGMQEKKTFLQKIFKLNPELINQKTE